jgi:hypothetical protein
VNHELNQEVPSNLQYNPLSNLRLSLKLIEINNQSLTDSHLTDIKADLIDKLTLNKRDFCREFRVYDPQDGLRMYETIVKVIGEHDECKEVVEGLM